MLTNKFDEKRPLKNLFYSGNNINKYDKISSCLLFGDMNRPVPDYTILIPTFKRPEYLLQALRSVQNQDVKDMDYDILIIDNENNPQSNTFSMLLQNKSDNMFYYQNEENLGAIGNWDRGFVLARTKWVMVLHDDDLLYPHAISAAVSAVNKLDNGRLGSVMAQIDCFNGFDEENTEPRRLTGRKREQILKNRAPKRSLKRLQLGLYDGPFAPTCGALFKRSAVLELGGYADDYKSDDMFFLYALSEKYNCYSLKESWGKYRMAVNDTLNEETQALLINDNILLNDYFLTFKQRGVIAYFDRKYRNQHPYMVKIFPLIELVEQKEQRAFLQKYFPDWAEYSFGRNEKAGFRRRRKIMAVYNLVVDLISAKRYIPFKQSVREKL